MCSHWPCGFLEIKPSFEILIWKTRHLLVSLHLLLMLLHRQLSPPQSVSTSLRKWSWYLVASANVIQHNEWPQALTTATPPPPSVAGRFTCPCVVAGTLQINFPSNNIIIIVLLTPSHLQETRKWRDKVDGVYFGPTLCTYRPSTQDTIHHHRCRPCPAPTHHIYYSEWEFCKQTFGSSSFFVLVS